MNGHGQCFQASEGIADLLGLNNPNGKVTVDWTPTTVCAMILAHSHTDNNPIFLSITKKWNSTVWRDTYILQQAGPVREFAQCPAAYLESTTTTIKQKNEISPDTVEDANLSEWDKDDQRMVTPSKRKAVDEEKDITALPWLIDMGALKSPISGDSAVKFSDEIGLILTMKSQ